MTISKITPSSTLAGAPYHDDWDETKGYKRILFQPGRAVQTRELNQLQTALQAEIDYLGQYTFADGSTLVGGASRQFYRPFVKLTTNLGTAAYSDWIGTTITGVGGDVSASGMTATVKRVENDATLSKDVLYVEYTNTGTDSLTHAFAAGETITSSAGNPDGASVVKVNTSAGTGVGSFITIDEGLYYYSGYYVFVEKQTILLNPYDNEPAYMVGYTVSETIVTSATDTSLLDNASGTPNTSAPGADRLAITATITKLELDLNRPDDSPTESGFADGVVEPDNWFSFGRIVPGQPIELQDPIHRDDTALSDRLEIRTFEESGHYAVDPFPINAVEDREGYWGGRYNDGLNPAGSVDKFGIKILSGHKAAYVHGRRIFFKQDRDSLASGALSIDKPRDADAIKTFSNGKSIGVTLGKYFVVENMYGLPEVDGHGFRWRNRLWNSAGIRVGSCRIRGIEADGDNRYRVYVWDVLMKKSVTGGDLVPKFIASQKPNDEPQWGPSSQDSSPGDSPDTPTASVENNWYCEIIKKLKHGKQNTIFKLPMSNVKTLLDGSDNNTIYKSRVTIKLTTGLTGGNAVFILPTGTKLADTNEMFYSVQQEITDSPSQWSKVQTLTSTVSASIPYYSGTPAGTDRVTVVDSALDINADTARLVVTVENIPATRNHITKVKQKLYQDTVDYAIGTKKYFLRYPDVTRVRLIYTELDSSTTNVDGSGFTDVTDFVVDSVTGIEVDDLVLSTTTPNGKITQPRYVHAINVGTKTISVNNKVTLADGDELEFKKIVNHTYKFRFDDGQTPSSYGLASITLKDGPRDGWPASIEDSPTTDNLHVLFDYFSHTGTGDYFSVDSYPVYRDIGRSNGFDLRDCLDFRPVAVERDAGWGGFYPFDGSHLCPAPGYAIELKEPQVYLPRKDRLWLTKDRKFVYQKGIPARIGVTEFPPMGNGPAESMLLYNVTCKPYVYNVNHDIEFERANNERYTMRDLRGIAADLKRLRFQVGQNLNRIGRGGALGPSDNPREEMGLVTDTFAGPDAVNSLADPNHPDFFIGYNVDGDYGSITAPHHRPDPGVSMVIDSTLAGSRTAVVESGVATAKLNSSTPYLNELVQNRSTRDITINPDGISSYQHGTIRLRPSSDIYGSDLYTQPAFTEYTWAGSWTWGKDVIGTYDLSDWDEGFGGVDLNGSNQAGGWNFNQNKQKNWNESITHARNQVFRMKESDNSIQRKGWWAWHDVEYLSTADYSDGIVHVRLDFTESWNDWGWWPEDFAGYHSYTPSRTISGVINTMRSRLVYFHASGLRGGATVIPYLGGHNVSAYCKLIDRTAYLAGNPGNMTDSDSPFEDYIGDTFISDGSDGVDTHTDLEVDGSGRVYGVMLIPSNNEISIPRGAAEFVLSSDQVTPFTPRENYTYGSATYFSDGRGRPLNSNNVTQNSMSSAAAPNINTAGVDDINWNNGSIAQTFSIENARGAFVKKLSLYFTARPSSGSDPVQVLITGTRNGGGGNGIGTGRRVPDPQHVFDATIQTIERSDVTVDATGNTATVIEFDHPVWLGPSAQRQYAIVILSNSSEYKLRRARAGEQQTEAGGKARHSSTNTRVKNLFRQSDGAWSWGILSQDELKFKLKRCNFDTTISSRFDICNAQTLGTRLDPDPFECIEVDSPAVSPSYAKLRVYHPNHGMYDGASGSAGHKVRFSGCGIGPTGITGLNTNNITPAELNYSGASTAFAVSNQTLHTYEIDVIYAGGTAPVLWDRKGYNSVRAKGNFMYDYFKPKIGQIWPEDTGVKMYLTKFTNGETIASTNSVSQETPTRQITNGTWHIMDDPGVVLSQENQEISGDSASATGKSLKMKVLLDTDDARVSPFITLDQSQFLTHQNLINNASDSPLDSEAAYTATEAKYITKRIDVLSIDNAAPTALDIWMDVNKPEGSSVEVWYKTDIDNVDLSESDADTTTNAEATEVPWDTLGWTQIVHEDENDTDVIAKNFRMSIEPKVIPTSDDPADIDYDATDDDNWPAIHYEIQDTTDIEAQSDESSGGTFVFNSYALKIVLKSTNSANVPSVRNLVIAASRHLALRDTVANQA